MISPAQRRLLLLTATFALSLLSCGREVTGPENGLNYGRARFGAVALSPQMPSLLASLEGASDVVPFERVRVVLRRTDGAIAVDTTVNFPSGVDSIELALLVPLPIDTPQEGLPLSLTMAYINAVGDTVFRGGPVGVVAPPVGSNITPQPILIPIVYDGVGKDAARVAISPDTGTRVAGSISTFTATAFDGQNAPIANTPILFYTLDSSRASIPEAGSGQVTWLPNRGGARIVAALPNGARADTAFVTVALPASKLVVQSGNTQSSAVGTALAQPIVLRTLASDDVPVAGVIVSFAVTSGAGALTVLTDTSDVNGEVSTNWTLGGTLGAQSITATSTGLTGSPLTLTATATAGAPARVVFTQVVTQAVAGVVLAPPVLVEVQDVAGNLVTSFTGPVLLTVTSESASGINGTTQQNAVGGIATFADISFDLVGAHNIIAILDSTARDTSAVINVAPGVATRLEFVAQPSGALAGIPFAPPVTVVAKDLMGNNATGFTGTVTLSLLNPAGATLGGSVAVAAVNGLATFSSLTVDKVGSAYVLAAASGALTPDSSATFAILPALPSGIVPIAGDGQTGPAGVALPTEIVVEVRDSFGNAVPDVTVNFVVELGGGSSSTTAAQTDALGRATTTWTLGPVVGAQTLRASAQGFPLATAVVGAVATVGAPTSVTFVQSPVTPQTAGVAFTPDVVIEVRDNGGNVVTNYNGPVTLGIANNPSGATLLGTLTVNAANGVATFPNILVQVAGVGFTLQATTDTLPPAISGAFDVVNATASVVTPVAGDGQAGIAGTLLADSLVVRVTDAFGNKVTGAQVIFTIDVGGGSIAPSTVITNALGEATSGWTLGTTVGTQNVTASIAGGANYQFSALADVGAPTAITIVSGNGQTGGAGTFLPTPIVVRVADAFNNPVPLTLVNFAIQTGGGSLTATSALTDASGQAQTFTTLGGVLGTQTILASIAGEISVLVTTNVVAGPAAAFTIVAGNNQSGAAGTPVSDTLRVRVADSFGNPLVNYRTEWTIQAGASVLADTLVFTDANGVASNTAVYGALTGPQLLATVVTPNVGSQLGFDAVITAGAATSFEFLVEPAGPVVAGATIANVVVRGLDAFSNPGATFDSVSIVRNSGPGSSTLSGTTTRASVGGIATFDDLSLDAAGTYSFRAERVGITSAVSGPLEVTAGAATAMTLVSGDNQIAAAGALYPQPMRVRVTDAFGNGVSNVQVAWLGINVTVPFDTTLTDVNGIAQTEPSAGILAGLGSVTATLVSVPTEIVLFDATVEAGVAAAVAVQTPPTDGTAGVDLGGFSVRANDAFGNLATSFTGPVTLTAQLTDGTPVSVIVQGDNVNAIGGIATFLTTRINTAGTYRLVADFGALGTVVTDSIVIEAADPSAIILVDGDGQSAGVTQSLASPLRVRVTDAFGNGIAGVNVNWGVISGLAEFSDTVAVTDGTGLAQTSAILGNTSGSISIGAFAAGLSGSPVTFTAVATAGTPFGLIAVSGGLQSAAAGTAFAQPFVVRVVDAFGNGVSGIEVTFDSPDGVSAFGDTVVTSDGSGLASTTAIAATTAGSSLIDASAPGVSPTSFGITITAGAAAALFNGALTLAGNAGDTYSPIDVSVLDAFGNTVTDFAGSVTIAVGVGPDGAVIGGTLTKPAVGGVVSFDDLVFTTAGNYSLAVTSDALPQINLPITINAATAATLAADGSPVRTGAAASTIAPPLAAKVTDAFGNPVSGAVVSWSIISGDITLSGPTSVTNALGVATIDVLAGPTAGSAEVTAAIGSVGSSRVDLQACKLEYSIVSPK